MGSRRCMLRAEGNGHGTRSSRASILDVAAVEQRTCLDDKCPHGLVDASKRNWQVFRQESGCCLVRGFDVFSLLFAFTPLKAGELVVSSRRTCPACFCAESWRPYVSVRSRFLGLRLPSPLSRRRLIGHIACIITCNMAPTCINGLPWSMGLQGGHQDEEVPVTRATERCSYMALLF